MANLFTFLRLLPIVLLLTATMALSGCGGLVAPRTLKAGAAT